MILDYIFWGIFGFFCVAFIVIIIKDAYKNRKEAITNE